MHANTYDLKKCMWVTFDFALVCQSQLQFDIVNFRTRYSSSIEYQKAHECYQDRNIKRTVTITTPQSLWQRWFRFFSLKFPGIFTLRSSCKLWLNNCVIVASSFSLVWDVEPSYCALLFGPRRLWNQRLVSRGLQAQHCLLPSWRSRYIDIVEVLYVCM